MRVLNMVKLTIMWTFRRRCLYLMAALLIGSVTLYYVKDWSLIMAPHHSVRKVSDHTIKTVLPVHREQDGQRDVGLLLKMDDYDGLIQNRLEHLDDAQPLKLSSEEYEADPVGLSSEEYNAEKLPVSSRSQNRDARMTINGLNPANNESRVTVSGLNRTLANSIRYLRKNIALSLASDGKQKDLTKIPTRSRNNLDNGVNRDKLGKRHTEPGSGRVYPSEPQRVLDRSQGSPRFWKKLDEYCNPPNTPVYGEEGQASSGNYHLRSVYVIMRHGDRTPLVDLRLPKSNWKPVWHCDIQEASSNPDFSPLAQLIASVTTPVSGTPHRRRVATYLQRLPVGVFSRMCARSQMTPQGWMQQILLGQHLRAAYTGTLFSKKATWRDPNIPVTIYSTTNSRTQQSAFAFMFGLLPELKHQDGSRLKILNNVNFCQGILCSCPAVNDLSVLKDRSFKKHQREDNRTSEVMRKIQKILFSPGTSKADKKLPGITTLQEIFLATLCHNMTLPCGTTRCVTTDEVYQMIRSTEDVAEELRSSEDGPHVRYARLNMHPLLSEIARDMEIMANKSKKRPHLLLYSGHDITLSPLVDVLGLPDHRWIPFASRIVFELWTDNFSQNYVRILFNGRDQMKYVRFCRDRVIKNGLCPLQYFSSFINWDNMQYFKTNSYAEACQLNFNL